MWSSRRASGFTLIEVLIAIAVLGVAATAAVSLGSAALRSLAAVKEERALLDETRKVYIQITSERPVLNGRRDELSWDTRNESLEVLDGMWTVQYKAVDVGYRGRKITFYVP